jgi:hypothetical protein
MAQQQAIYDQNCKLIVSRIMYALKVYLTSIVVLRIQVRSFGPSSRTLLTRTSHSGPISPERLSPGARRRSIVMVADAAVSKGRERRC